jgi:hypothetical protein
VITIMYLANVILALIHSMLFDDHVAGTAFCSFDLDVALDCDHVVKVKILPNVYQTGEAVYVTNLVSVAVCWTPRGGLDKQLMQEALLSPIAGTPRTKSSKFEG